MTVPNTLPAAHPTRQAVEAQFLTRPTLRTVTVQLLASKLKEKYPPLTHPVDNLRLAIPREGGGWSLSPLLEVALSYMADGSFPDLATQQGRDCYLSTATGNRLSYQFNGSLRDYDLSVIEDVIRELPSLVPIAFQEDLAAYWGQDSDAGISRWKWLADVLQGALLESATRLAVSAAQPLKTLSTLNRYPDRATRAARPAPENAVHAYTLETHLERAGTRLTLQASDLLVVCQAQVLLCHVSGVIEPYPDLDAFGQAWGERMQQRLAADNITWQQYEPDGNIFEVQAALILNQQLDDLAAIEFRTHSTVQALEHLFAEATNPTLLLAETAPTPLDTLSSIQTNLPDWLQRASAADRLAYRQCLIEQAGIRRETLGDTDFDGLETLHTYASQHLNHQLCLDREQAQGRQRTCSEDAQSSGYTAEDLELTFHVPVGSLEGGYIEKVSMSLVELALKNLSGKPKGSMTIKDRNNREIEAWLTADYILELIQRVDIGLNYPNYLRQELMSDTEAAQKRQRLFQQQRPVHLKTQTLEQKLKGEAGLTSRGVQYMNAVLSPDPMERQVEGNAIVIRPLAFLRKQGATADVVQNMFIIEPLDTQLGPHLLYRPTYPDSLREFAGRAHLLAAIVQPGELQNSVLTWLPDNARAIYSNGGFTEPHIVRTVSDFDPLPPVPKPAELAKAGDASGDELLQWLNNGNLMEYLFGSETRQLLDQAERESTSNRESRWARIVEGIQLGFNTLLIAIRGPLAAVGWLMQLAQGLTHDLPALESDDPLAKELAWVDLLLNIGMLVVHHGPPVAVADSPTFDQQRLIREPFRRPLPGAATSRVAVVERGVVGLPSEPPGGGETLMDFDHSLAGDSASARLLEKLRQVNVPWPEPAPEPVKIGIHAGLYGINGLWHASVGGLLFRVSIVPGFGEVFIIHPEHPDHPGIKLKTDGQGHWTLDRGLKLLGGGKGKRIKEQEVQNQSEVEKIQETLIPLNLESVAMDAPYKAAKTQVSAALEALKKQRAVVQLTASLLKRASDAQRPALEARHLQEMANHQTRRTEFQILLQNLEDLFSQAFITRQKIVAKGKELEIAGRGRIQIKTRPNVLKGIWDDQALIHNLLRSRLTAMEFSRAGEPLIEMLGRMYIENLLGDRSVYDEYISNMIELANIHKHLAEVTAAMETTLQQLEKDSPAGRNIRTVLLATIDVPQNFFSDNLKLIALNYLAETSVNLLDVVFPAQEDVYIQRFKKIKLFKAVLSHIEVRSSDDYLLAEQREVYETVLKEYQACEETIRALKIINPHRLLPGAERLLEGLEYAKALAQAELETVVRNQEELTVKLPLSKTFRPKPPTRRVFRTRHKQTLIGDLKPADAQTPTEHFTISNRLTGNTVTEFRQDADGWTDIAEVVEDPSPPMPAPDSRPLATLKNQGNELIKQRVGIERTVTSDQQNLDSPLTRQQVNPDTWDKLLTAHAEKFTALADEIKRDHLDKPTAQTLIDEYLAQARDLARLSQRICSDAYKRQWPTPEGLQYLWDHQEIDINLTSLADPQRPTLSGDFFTEYAVYDKAKKPPVVLWYAHFHYAAADAPPGSYTRAHLKLPEQRKFTQKDLLKEHVQAYLHNQTQPGSVPSTYIIYVLIKPPLDQMFLAIAPTPRASQ